MAVFRFKRQWNKTFPLGTQYLEYSSIGKMFTSKSRLVALATTILLNCVANQVQANPHHIELGIVAQPKSVLAEEGSNVTLAVLIQGPVKSVQWRKNGIPIESANNTYLEVIASQGQPAPDTYDIMVQDPFGNSLVSEAATVDVTPADSPVLISQNRRIESLKLQSLFNLIHVFDHVTARVYEPMEYQKVNHASQAYYPPCPDRSTVKTIEPAVTQQSVKHELLLELNACFVPKTNQLGEESGALINGKYRRSSTSIQLTNKEVQVLEQFAEKLSLRFPYSKDWGNSNTIDFDISINGGLTLQTEINRSAPNVATIRKESIWRRGTSIQNPQTGVNAEFISGKYVQETFGAYRRNEFMPNRETELFDKLTMKVAGETVVINGAVTKIYDKSEVHRHGQFSISVNGKHVLNTHSVVTAPARIQVTLPNAPKLNGFFLNDHSKTKPKAPIKMVSPGRELPVKIN